MEEDAADSTLFMPETEQYLIENRADALLSTTDGVSFSATSDGVSQADDDTDDGSGADRSAAAAAGALAVAAVLGAAGLAFALRVD